MLYGVQVCLSLHKSFFFTSHTGELENFNGMMTMQICTWEDSIWVCLVSSVTNTMQWMLRPLLSMFTIFTMNFTFVIAFWINSLFFILRPSNYFWPSPPCSCRTQLANFQFLLDIHTSSWEFSLLLLTTTSITSIDFSNVQAIKAQRGTLLVTKNIQSRLKEITLR